MGGGKVQDGWSKEDKNEEEGEKEVACVPVDVLCCCRQYWSESA
jgi:hypothetical protein